MKYYLPIHLDGGNRGCEAITKATALILKSSKRDIIAYTKDIHLDLSLNIDKYVTLQECPSFSFFFKLKRKIGNFFLIDPFKKKKIVYKFVYDNFMKQIQTCDIMLSTGGDMLCYGDNEVIYTNEYLYNRQIKTILWGCSIGEQNLNLNKISTLKHFALVYARESLTKKMLEEQGLRNVYLFPDPAFILKPEICNLPICFTEGDVIGLNLSNYVVGGDSLNTNFGKSLVVFLDYIIEKTNYKILLIPHVFWHGQDDRLISKIIQKKYVDSGRVSVLASENLNYCQIRYIISKCRFFIGARTHAVISAYATCIPTLALGYSIKSKGIAKDLVLPDETVIDCVNWGDDNKLLTSFNFLMSNEIDIKKNMQRILPEYIKSVWQIKEVLNII